MNSILRKIKKSNMFSRGRGENKGGSERGEKGGKRSLPGDPHQSQVRESAITLEKYMDKRILIKFAGGRQVTGTLKGFDQLLNVVIDESVEIVKATTETPETSRSLGLVVARGPNVLTINSMDGAEEIENPFAMEQESE